MNRYEGQFANTETAEIVRMLKSAKSNPGATSARIEWELELKAELKRRGVPYPDSSEADSQSSD